MIVEQRMYEKSTQTHTLNKRNNKRKFERNSIGELLRFDDETRHGRAKRESARNTSVVNVRFTAATHKLRLKRLSTLSLYENVFKKKTKESKFYREHAQERVNVCVRENESES